MKRGIKALTGLGLLAIVSGAQAQFQLLVTETPMGSVPSNQWMGVRRYNVAGTGGAATLGNGIAAAQVSDPAGLTFSSSGELFVGNRHGNGAASSVSRFLYDSGSDSFLANGTITGNSLFGVHGINFSNTGELFAANVNGPISRFTFPGGIATPNGTMGSGASRDVFFSPDGLWAYATQGVSGNLLKYDLSNGNQVGSFSIAGAGGLHNGSWRGNTLFLAGFGTATIHAIDFAANGDVSSSSIVANVNSAIGIAFSPDQQEMFVSGHTSGLISRFLNSGGNWVANGTIDTGVNLGDIIVAPVQPVPEPATLATVGIGVAALLRRRKRA